jgi:hypothetical protein
LDALPSNLPDDGLIIHRVYLTMPKKTRTLT